MKIGIVGDVHWSKYSSIVRSRGDKYSTRLENCIQSVNWAEGFIEKENCDIVVYLGDFFDSSDLNAEEISALNDITWNKLKHYFVVGNHEMGLNDLSFSSSHLLNLCDNIEVIAKPTTIVVDSTPLCFIPYVLENNRQPFKTYIDTENSIVFSHNDLKGIQMGRIISPSGFELEEIHNACRFFINGHIHNGSVISKKIINVGNLTGQNFSEDATIYHHHIMILDTDTCDYSLVDNPYAFNFVKFDDELDGFALIEEILNATSNVVCTLKVKANNREKYNEILADTITNRVIIEPEVVHSETNLDALESLSVNHLDKFREYVINELGTSAVVMSELDIVTR